MPDYIPGEFRVARSAGYCALPIIGDTYRNCTGGCLYCYEKQCTNQHLRKQGVVPRDYRRLFNSLYDDYVVNWYRETFDVPVRIGVLSEPFSPAENKYRNTYQLLKLLARANVPVQFTTKRPDVINDHHIAVMKDLPKCMVRCSIGCTDDEIAKELEPGGIPPSERFRHLERLANAGIEVGVRFSPHFYIYDYDYGAVARCGASNVTVEAFRFSLLWRHSTDPHIWEVLSGEEFPGGNVAKKGSFARQWVEEKEKAYFAPMQSLDIHPYQAPGNLWVYTDIFKVRDLWLKERAQAKEHGLRFGICGFGCGVHNIDLNDAPCGCLSEGWSYDPGALVPAWHKNQWADYIIPQVYNYPIEEGLERFLVANSAWDRPIALDADPKLPRGSIQEDAEVELEGESTRGIQNRSGMR